MTHPSIPGKILAAADAAVSTERPNTHGDAVVNHGAIAILWNAYITAKTYAAGGNVDTMKLLGAADAAQMMVLFKMARTISGNPTHADHYVDAAGYTALAARMWGAEPDDGPAPPVTEVPLPGVVDDPDGSFARPPIQRQTVPDTQGINDDPMAAERERYLNMAAVKVGNPDPAEDDGA